MIRNYQRSGGGTANLEPIYSRLNLIQNEINILRTATAGNGDFSAISASIDSIIGSIDQMSAYTEWLTGSVTRVSESVNSLSSSIDEITGNIDRMSVYTEWLTGSVTQISDSVGYMRDSIYSLSDSLYSISTSVTSLSFGNEFVTGSVTYLSSQFQTLYQVVTSQTFAIDTKLRVLEQSIGSNNTKIAELSDNTEAQRLSINSLASSIMNINGVLSTLSTATGGGGGADTSSFTSYTAAAGSSFNSLSSSITDLSTAFTSHTSIFDYVFQTYTSAVKASFNSVSSSIMDLTAPVKTLINPTLNSHTYTDPVLYSGPFISTAAYPVSAKGNVYMKGVTLSNIVSTTVSGNDKTRNVAMRDCTVYGDASFIDIHSAYLSAGSLTRAIFNRCSTVNIINNTADSIDIIDASTISVIDNTFDTLRIVSGGLVSARGVNIREFDVTANTVSMRSNANMDIVNIYCDGSLVCDGNSMGYLNLSVYQGEVIGRSSSPYLVGLCSIAKANCLGITPNTGIVTPQRLMLDRCTFHTLAMDVWYASAVSNVVTGIANLTINNVSLSNNTWNGIVAGTFSNLNMTNNSFTVANLYYLNSAGYGNNIAVAQSYAP